MSIHFWNNTFNWPSTLDFLKSSCWVSVLQELPMDLGKISYSFEKQEEWRLSFEDFLEKFSFIDKKQFDTLKTENIWENSLFEIYKTYNFLIGRFQKSQEKLTKNGFLVDDIIDTVMKRLVFQVIEAGNSERKLKNGMVVWLSKYSKSEYVFMKVPYYAFASTNVSLDVVKVRNRSGKEYTLREIDSLMNSKNDEWGFFLPNSMWVSASLMTTDKNGNLIFISQERNNATTLSQNNARYIASASWAVDFKMFENGENLHLLHSAVGQEVQEELWIYPLKSQLSQEKITSEIKGRITSLLDNTEYEQVQILWNILHQEWHDILGRELGLEVNLLPSALVMEEKRRNPEFIFLGKVGYSVEQIKDFWEMADSKDESLSIRGISYQDIQEEIKNRKNGWEKQIDDHFFMSYIWFLLKITSQELEKMKLDII